MDTKIGIHIFFIFAYPKLERCKILYFLGDSMVDMVQHKFNIKKAVNNRYKPTKAVLHNLPHTLHNISREEYQFLSYYSSTDTLSNIVYDNMLYEYIESVDYDRYERWLEDGGRY
jgi:hypothetical protein